MTVTEALSPATEREWKALVAGLMADLLAVGARGESVQITVTIDVRDGQPRPHYRLSESRTRRLDNVGS